MKLFEKIALGLFVLIFLFNRIDSEAFFSINILLSLLFFLSYATGGYLIFKPQQPVKFSGFVSVLNGITIGVCLYFILRLLHSVDPNRTVFWVVFIGIFLMTLVPVLLLYLKNRKIPENKTYLKITLLRNGIPLCMLLFLIVIPNKARVVLCVGKESNQYYSLRQEEFNDEVYEYCDKDDMEAAIRCGLEAVSYSKLRRNTSDELYQNTLNALGYAYYLNSDHLKADSVLHVSLQLGNSPFFATTTQYYRAVYYLGLNYSSRGYYRRSDSLLYVSLRERETPLDQSYVYGVLANNQNKRGNFFEADSLYRITVAKHEASGFENYGSFLATLTELSDNLVDMTRYQSADSLYLDCLTRAREHMGNSSIEVADIYDKLADLNSTLSKYKEAKSYALKGLEIKEALQGKEGTGYLYTLYRLTAINMALSEYDKAESTLQSILTIIESKYNIQGPLAMSIFKTLSNLYTDYSNYDKAEFYADKSLNASYYWYGDGQLGTVNAMDNRAYIYYCRANYIMADSLYDKSLHIKLHFTGRENLSYAHSLNGLGLVYTATNKLGKADTLFDYTEGLVEKLVGREHPDYATVLGNRSALFLKEMEIEKAEANMANALAINKKTFGAQHLNIAQNLLGMANINIHKKQYAAAIANYSEALAIYKKLFKFVHPQRVFIEAELKKLAGR